MKSLKYKPFKEQSFLGDILCLLKNLTHEEKKVLGSPINSGVDYTGLIREQNCPVVPLDMASVIGEKRLAFTLTRHPYWQMFEFGSFEFKGEEKKYYWVSSITGRQIFVTPDKVLADFFYKHLGNVESNRKSIFLEEKGLGSGKKLFNINLELPSGEKLEACLEYDFSRFKQQKAAMIPSDNHSKDRGLLALTLKGKGGLGNAKNSWIKINRKKYNFCKALSVPIISGGNVDTIAGAVLCYDRDVKFSVDSFSIINRGKNSRIKYSIKRDKDEVSYINRSELYESIIKCKLFGEAEEIYRIESKMAGKKGTMIKFNPYIPDLRYYFKKPYTGKFFLSNGKDFPGIIIGRVQAKHLGKFIVFDLIPEKPKIASSRTLQMAIHFTGKDEYKIANQIFSL